MQEDAFENIYTKHMCIDTTEVRHSAIQPSDVALSELDSIHVQAGDALSYSKHELQQLPQIKPKLLLLMMLLNLKVLLAAI